MSQKSIFTRFFKWAIVAWFKRQGWAVEGTAPMPRKFVVIAAPHTSNWDFVYFIGAADALNLDLSFMGKKSLFRWPFERVMREMGGIPVDRSSSHNYVDQIAEEYARRDELMLTIAPEGTRNAVPQWRTGFYHIAMKANVPIVCGMMDYRRKIVGLGPAIMPTGDFAKDMEPVAQFYAGCTAKFPEKTNSGVVIAKSE
jgi:1-acyl-sn-glycerol-3-phosphate acyltransferase